MSEKKQENTNGNDNLEIVEGNGKDLNISPVYDHIKMDKTSNTTDKKEKIVIPKKIKK